MRIARLLVVALIAQCAGQILVGAPAAQATPGNDNRESALVLSAGQTVVVDTTSATLESGENTSCGNIGRTVWFHVPNEGGLILDTRGSDFDTVVANTRFSPPQCSDDGWGLRAIAQNTEGGLVQVGGYGGAGGRLVVRASRSGSVAANIATEDGEAIGGYCMSYVTPDGTELSRRSGGSGFNGGTTMLTDFIAGEYGFLVAPCSPGLTFYPQLLLDANRSSSARPSLGRQDDDDQRSRARRWFGFWNRALRGERCAACRCLRHREVDR